MWRHALKSSFARLRQAVLALIVLAALLASAPPVHAQFTLHLWYSWDQDAELLLKSWVEGYQASTNNIIIEAEYVPLYELRQRFINTPNADRPDMFFAPSAWSGDLFANALTTPLDVKLNAAYRAQVSDLAWQTTRYNQKTLGVPIALDGLVLYYNTALVPADKVAKTWDELLTQASITPNKIGLSMGSGFYPTAGWYLAYGGGLIDEKGHNQLTSEDALRQYFTRIKDLYDRSGGSIQIGSAGTDFRIGNGLYAIDGTWQYWENRAMLTPNFGVAPLPAIDGKAWRPMVRSTLLYISASSRQMDVSLAFGRYITSAEVQTAMAKTGLFIPVNPNAEIEDKDVAAVAQFLQSGIPQPTRPELINYYRAFQQQIDEVTIRGKSPDAAARDVLTQFVPLTATPKPRPTPRS
jgi:maltose-binding protein MalE